MKHISIFIAIISILSHSTIISDALPVETAVNVGSSTIPSYEVQTSSLGWIKAGINNAFKGFKGYFRVNPWMREKEESFEKILDTSAHELASLSKQQPSVHRLIEPYVKECITICAKAIHALMLSDEIKEIIKVVWKETQAKSSKEGVLQTEENPFMEEDFDMQQSFQYQKIPKDVPYFDDYMDQYYRPLVTKLEKLGNSEDKNSKRNIWIHKVLPILSEVISMFGQLSHSATRGYVLDHLEEYFSTLIEFERVFFPGKLHKELESFIKSPTGKRFLKMKDLRSRLADKMKMEEILPVLQEPVIPFIKFFSHMAFVTLSSDAAGLIESWMSCRIIGRFDHPYKIRKAQNAIIHFMKLATKLTPDDIKKKLTQTSSSASTSVSNGIPSVMLLALEQKHIKVLYNLLLQNSVCRASCIEPFKKEAAKRILADFKMIEWRDVMKTQLLLAKVLLPKFSMVLTSETVKEIIFQHNPDEYRAYSTPVPDEPSSIVATDSRISISSEQSSEATFNGFNLGLRYPGSSVSNNQATGLGRLTSF